MSEFSECLNRIRINKNLYVIDLARLMNMDPSTISKWISGERKPRSRDVLDKLLGKMKLSDYDKKILIEAYEEELIGKENYTCIKLWKEIIDEIKNKKYKIFLKNIITNIMEGKGSVKCPYFQNV